MSQPQAYARCAYVTPNGGRCYHAVRGEGKRWCAEHKKGEPQIPPAAPPKTLAQGERLPVPGMPGWVTTFEKPSMYCLACHKPTRCTTKAINLDVEHQAFTVEQTCKVCSAVRAHLRIINRPQGQKRWAVEASELPRLWIVRVL